MEVLDLLLMFLIMGGAIRALLHFIDIVQQKDLQREDIQRRLEQNDARVVNDKNFVSLPTNAVSLKEMLDSAVKGGHTVAIKNLLARGAKPDLVTVLHACAGKYDSLVELKEHLPRLLRGYKHRSYNCLLDTAARETDHRILKLLFECGGEDFKSEAKRSGVIEVAVQHASAQTVQLLADLGVPSDGGNEVIQACLTPVRIYSSESGIFNHFFDDKQRTDNLRVLINAGFKITDPHIVTAVRMEMSDGLRIMLEGRKELDILVVRGIINGFRKPVITNSRNSPYQTLAELAASLRGCEQLAFILAEHGALVNGNNDAYWSNFSGDYKQRIRELGALEAKYSHLDTYEIHYGGLARKGNNGTPRFIGNFTDALKAVREKHHKYSDTIITASELSLFINGERRYFGRELCEYFRGNISYDKQRFLELIIGEMKRKVYAANPKATDEFYLAHFVALESALVNHAAEVERHLFDSEIFTTAEQVVGYSPSFTGSVSENEGEDIASDNYSESSETSLRSSSPPPRIRRRRK